jgi:foldase protein PrsA
MVTFMKKIILLLLLVVFAFSGCSSSGSRSDDYVLTINGEKVSKGEYMVYLREQRQFFEESGGEDIWEVDNIDGISPEDLAKQNAINSVIQTKIAVMHFDGYNITLTDEDDQKIDKKASALYEEIGEDKAKLFSVSLNDIKKITRELYIGDKVFELQTNGVTLDDDEFETEFNSYIADNIKDYRTVTLKQIAFSADSDGYNKAMEANDKILAGADYDSVMLEYSTDNNNDAFTLTDNMYSTRINTTLYNMQAGSVSDVLKDDDGTYYIFKVVSVDTADMDPVRESYKAQCLQEKKQEVYNAQIEKWQADVSIERNDEIYNSISVFDC